MHKAVRFPARHPKVAASLFVLLLLWFWFCLPSPLFNLPYSFALYDQNESLLGARIATDGQWRFPLIKKLPDKFAQSLIAFEDKRFYWHQGIDPIGIARAMRQNLAQGKVVSGGSTITMQVIRLARNGRSRSVFEKMVEAIMALRLELTYSKKDILRLYASHAPFGGNVVGLEAASWRYYGKDPLLLSWAEAATLAVLPNSPALIHPGRNREKLRAKRDRLLQRLCDKGFMDKTELDLSLDEPLPNAPLALPDLAPHLLERAKQEHPDLAFANSTLRKPLQEKSTAILEKHQHFLAQNGIHNAAAFIMDVETGNVLAYIGNIVGAGDEHGDKVDVIPAPRSTGSILKPFLYAMLLDDGGILPKSLISDVPTQLAGYRPENYKQTYDGAIAADRSLIRSLNIPAIRMLQQYGIEKFHANLRKWGMSSLTQPADYYGLPIVLGGAEGKLWEITGIYASMARVLNHYYEYEGEYDANDLRGPNYLKTEDDQLRQRLQKQPTFLSAAACHFTFEAMQYVERPSSESSWEEFRSKQRIAWKTGTSFGYRDAWAVGVTPRYAVGVWVGNADGEGRPDLVGVLAAAPILFDLFSLLESSPWFDPPYDEMLRLPVCKHSGYRAIDYCTAIDTQWVQPTGVKATACPYCTLLHTDKGKQWQINSDCANFDEIQPSKWFVLPPLEEYYYKNKHPDYAPPPPVRPDCQRNTPGQGGPLELAYPRNGAIIYVPIGMDGEKSKTIFRATHRDANSTVYWHLDNRFIGKTVALHEIALGPPSGKHLLTLVDDRGYRVQANIEVLQK